MGAPADTRRPTAFRMASAQTPTGTPSLSDREMQVLRLAATGATNNQIARDLSISPNTVKVHLNNIFTKLGVQSRTEASLYAVRQGWIEIERVNAPAPAPTDGPAPAASALAVAAELPATVPLPEPGALLPAPAAMPVPPRFPLRWRMLAVATGVVVVGVLIVILNNARLLPFNPPAQAPQAIAAPSPIANIARWQSRAALSSAREALAVVPSGGAIYVIGGLAEGAALTDTLAYDPATNAWQARAPKPTAVQGASAAATGGRIYVPGGCDESDRPVTALEIYDPARDEWQAGPDMPRPLCHFALAALEGKLYVIGGWDGAAATADVWAFDPARGTWTAQAPLPSARSDAGAAVAGDRIYVIGGRDGDRLLPDVLAFDPAGASPWTAQTPMPAPRAGSGVAALAGNIYVFGGGWSAALKQNQRFDTRANAWTPIEDTPDPLRRVGGIAALDTKIYLFGGWNGAPTASVQEYTALYRFFIPNSGN